MKQRQNTTPDLRLRRRRGRVASEDNSNHPPFCIRRQLPSKQKEVSCYRFRQRVYKRSNIHRLGKPFLIALETGAEKIRIPCSHAKKIRIRNLRFRKIHFRERFRKAPFWGPSVFKKLRIRADTCDRFYVSGVEKLRFRKDPGTCARSLRATFGRLGGWEEGERRERNKQKRQPGRTGAGQRGEWQLNEQRKEINTDVIYRRIYRGNDQPPIFLVPTTGLAVVYREKKSRYTTPPFPTHSSWILRNV